MAKPKRLKPVVETNDVRVRENYYETSDGPYHTWRNERGLNAEEPASANPDTLADTPANRLWGQGAPSELAEIIIERFTDELGNFPILSKRQNEVLRLTLMGLSVTEVGLELKLDPRRVSTYLRRIQLRFKRLIKTL